MRQREVNRGLILVCASLVALPSVALANPSPLAGPYAPYIGLFVEAIMIAVILGRKGCDPLRFLYSWVLVTGVTFSLLVGGFNIVDSLDWSFSSGIVMFILAEAAIVWIEALAMFHMAQRKFFQRETIIQLTFREALKYSMWANVASFVIGS